MGATGRPPPGFRAESGSHPFPAEYDLPGDFQIDRNFQVSTQPGLLFYHLVGFADRPGRLRLQSYWVSRHAFEEQRLDFQSVLKLPEPRLPATLSPIRRAQTPLHQLLTSGTAKGWAVVAGVITLVATLLPALGTLQGIGHRWKGDPPDVVLTPREKQVNAEAGRPFSLKIAVDDYTGWHQPCVWLTAILQEVNGQEVPKASIKVDPEFLNLKTAAKDGQATVEVSGTVADPREYQIALRLLTRYDPPTREERAEAKDPYGLPRRYFAGEQTVVPLTVFSSQAFGQPLVGPAIPDRRKCLVSIGWTPGRTYAEGARFQAFSPAGVWFFNVEPSQGNTERIPQAGPAPGGGSVRWSVGAVPPFQPLAFFLALESTEERTREQWEQVAADLIFSANPPAR